MAYDGIGAAIDRVAFVVLLPAPRLDHGVVRMAAPGPRIVFGFPFGHRQRLAVFGLVAAKGDEALLGPGQRFHPRGIGGVGGGIHVRPFATAEDIDVHQRVPPRCASAIATASASAASAPATLAPGKSTLSMA